MSASSGRSLITRPAGLNVVNEDGQLLFHNARVRELLGYDEQEMELFDTRRFWMDQNQRGEIIEMLRKGGQVINREVIWKTRQGEPVNMLISYPQVAYRGGHVSFVGGRRVAWCYDITALKKAEAAHLRSEQRLIEAIESISEGLGLIMTPMTGWCFAIHAIAKCRIRAARSISGRNEL